MSKYDFGYIDLVHCHRVAYSRFVMKDTSFSFNYVLHNVISLV